MKNLYIFSGLGVDQRVFKYLDFTGFNVTFINWIKPTPTESIEDYAKRLTTQIYTKKPVLIGLSFGGMMAVEVAKLISTQRIILIASAKTYTEIPFYFRWLGYLKMHKIIPTQLLKYPGFINYWFFGVKNKVHKALLAEILNDLDTDFLKWAIDKIVCWQNQTMHSNTIHIHCNNDHILPLRYINCNYIVSKGGHFMTVDKAKQISQLLHKILS
ncbi:alpha/beta hydrolase [Emticicia soli]|uniref:Alpha/beta hydrolase n=1 Tax=Emticicia soli TaxID=2027878 RepID=A0ABW5J951_9BACT